MQEEEQEAHEAVEALVEAPDDDEEMVARLVVTFVSALSFLLGCNFFLSLTLRCCTVMFSCSLENTNWICNHDHFRQRFRSQQAYAWMFLAVAIC